VDAQTVRKTFQYQLNPTPEQERTLAHTLMRCRHLYNAAVGERREAWQKCGVSAGYYQQKAELPCIKTELLECGEVNARVLQDVVQRVDRAFQVFFRRIREGRTSGYPRFHGRNRYNSFTYPQVGEHGGARLDNGFLVLPKIGRIAVRWSRPIEGPPKTVTISREADGWYAYFSCADIPVQLLPSTGQETGIDLGLESFATLADGAMIHNPRCRRRADRRLKTAQRRVSRRTKGSNRRKKAVKVLARAHQKVRRPRADFHHKAAHRLVQTNDTIYYEDLQTANMVQNHHLAKSVQDAGWSAFLSILRTKAAYAGRRVVTVPSAYISQRCSGPKCGVLVVKGLSVRWHSCPQCGTSLHRDHNVALHILRLGREQERAGQALRGGVASAAS
jgi:putative transposase